MQRIVWRVKTEKQTRFSTGGEECLMKSKSQTSWHNLASTVNLAHYTTSVLSLKYAIVVLEMPTNVA